MSKTKAAAKVSLLPHQNYVRSFARDHRWASDKAVSGVVNVVIWPISAHVQTVFEFTVKFTF